MRDLPIDLADGGSQFFGRAGDAPDDTLQKDVPLREGAHDSCRDMTVVNT
jgi:hypothetical protein